jgi:hypothetical protein
MRGILPTTRVVITSGVDMPEVEGMDMPEVEDMDMDMVEEQDHQINHRLWEVGMNMVGSNMVEVDGMDTVEEHFHPMSTRGGGYGYGGGAFSSDESPTGSGRYVYGGGAFPPDEPPTRGGGYGYGGYWYGGG